MLKRKKFNKLTHGNILIPLLFIIIAFAILLTSGAMVNKSAIDPNSSANANITCCDTGNGNACKPQTGAGQTLTYNGTQYGLLRSKMTLVEGNLHLKDSGQKFDGNPIILNSSEKHAIGVGYDAVNRACNRLDPVARPKDLYFKKNPTDPYLLMRTAQPESVIAQYCDSIPDDELIFVCKENCTAAACSFPVTPSENISCYGNDKSVFDVYYRIADSSTTGIPDFVKNCDTTSLQSYAPTYTPQRIVTPTGQEDAKGNLQLQTFQMEEEGSVVPWLSPLCKPAIYLYPQSTMPVTVKINPVGPIKVTIPLYPQNGWSVIANPQGQIVTNNKTYDYLYYEAEIPDDKIEKPKDGYIVAKKELSSLFETLLPKLGLNPHEKDQFSEYWLKALPNAPYYFVGIVPVSNLNAISPLTIIPKPTTSIRVTLYFEALEKPVSVTKPNLSAINRVGFTMVEWGGIFKKTPNYPFSCFQ